jgi:DNA-directed RNA polymerase specialized sigma24 family protein
MDDLVSTLDPKAVLAASRAVALMHTPRPYRHWIPDLASEVALRVVDDARRGYFTTSARYRWLLSKSIRKFFGAYGTRRSEAECAMEYGDLLEAQRLVADLRVDDLALSFRALQRAWPGLTETQQRAVALYLRGHNSEEMASAMGVSRATAHQAARRGLERAADPTQFTRSARMRLVGPLRCARCGEQGHNTRWCPRRDTAADAAGGEGG